jgi:4-amino-4-deoxy-L-arabinose transferase-like glycosyltransferase
MATPAAVERTPRAATRDISPLPRAGGIAGICAAVFLIALALRVGYAYTRPIPVTADAAYYLHVARNLEVGRGFVADYVWHYLAGVPDGLPVPSNSYWMPGTSVSIVSAFRIAGQTSLRVAQSPSLLLGAVLCAIAASIAGRVTKRREAALLAGAAAAVNYYLIELSLIPDHFMLYAVLVNLSLLALWAAWRGAPSTALVAGALAALAYLTRTDGGLLVIVALFLALFFRRRARRSHSLRLIVAFGIAFAIIATPWWTRQTLVFGSPSGASPSRTAFLTDYADLFRVDQSGLTAVGLLQQGPVVAGGIRAYSLYRSLRVLAKSLLVLAPLFLAGLWLSRTRQDAAPWLIYCALALLVPAALVPYHVLKGTSWHILPALLPGLLALAVAAALRVVDLARPRRIAWLAWAFVATALLSPSYFFLRPPSDASGEHKPLYPAIAEEAVDALGPRPVLALTDSSWGLHHVAHISCAQFPSDGPEAALLVAEAIGATYVITRSDETHTRPAIAYMQDINAHPRFRPLTRYQDGQGALLVYRILPPPD